MTSLPAETESPAQLISETPNDYGLYQRRLPEAGWCVPPGVMTDAAAVFSTMRPDRSRRRLCRENPPLYLRGVQQSALLACFFIGIAVCACDDRRVVTDIDVDVSLTGADGVLLDAESSPVGEVVLRTRNECVDEHLNLCLCDDGAYALVRLNYTGNGRFNAFDLATSKDLPLTSTGLIVQIEFQSIRSAYSHGELYRFGDENDLESNDLGVIATSG